MKRPFRIGLAGGYCAGKNEAARCLEARGFLCLDMDAVGHQALASSAEAVIERFGREVIGLDGLPDRKALGRIVFNDSRALADLEAILHPAMEKTARFWIESHPDRDLCVNAALLHKMGLMAMLDAAIEVRAPLLLRLLRGMRRDGLSLRGALLRIRSQRDFPRLLRERGKPVLAVFNSGGRAALAARMDAALEKLSLK